MNPYLFAEPFAGSAALTYWLLGGKPPISYMGSKVGFAPVIADILGLSQHHKPAGIILGEPGPFAAVHATLAGASGSTKDVAGWVHANAVSMVKDGNASGYSRVNGEGNDFTDRHGAQGHWHATTPEVSAQRVEDAATWLACAGQSFRIGQPDSGYNKTEAEGGNRETYGAVRPWMERIAPTIGDGPLPAARQVAAIIRSWKDEEPRALWERLKAKGWPSLLLPEGCRGRWLGPASVEEVAGWTLSGAWCYKQGDHASGGPVLPGERRQDTSAVAVAVASTPVFPSIAVWQGFAEDLVLPADLSGVVAYMDPPYQGTTAYKHGNCDRETVLRLAREWSERGATVAISEAARLDRELGEGWHAVQIDHARRGAKRTFSKQQDEWVTLNRPPVHVPGKQLGMFG